MFFFLTLFVQNVWGYDALRTGISYLPMVAMILVATAAASQLVSRIGALAADDSRQRDRHRRDVLAVPDHRAPATTSPACSGR